MVSYTAAGILDVVQKAGHRVAEQTGADEVIVAQQSPRVEHCLRSAELFAYVYFS